MFYKTQFLRIWVTRFILTLAVATALILPFVLQFEMNREEVIKARHINYISNAQNTIESVFHERLGDLKVLANTPSVSGYLIQQDDFTHSTITHLFQAFCRAYGQYDQVRLIRHDGQELVRVNYDDGHCVGVPQEELQTKVDRYYFKRTLKLTSDEVFVSPLDLNVEHGKVEVPHKPIIRFATPVVDNKSETRSVLVLNYLAKTMLDKLFLSQEQTSSDTNNSDFLVNEQGYYLHSERSQGREFGFMFGRDKERFSKDYPDVWQARLDGETSVRTKDGIFLMRALPVPVSSINEETVDVGEVASSRNWYLFHLISNKNLNEASFLYGPYRLSWLGMALLTVAIISALWAERRIRRDQLYAAMEELERLSVTDKLTGLFNRMKLDETFEHEIHRAERYRSPLSVILLDVDHFKKVNDIYGHQVGDETLQEIAKILYARLRDSDTLGRWGGEEFLIICPETDLENARILAENLRQSVAEHDFLPVGRKTCSVGVANWLTGEREEALIARVDAALYRAKGEGRNRVVVGEP